MNIEERKARQDAAITGTGFLVDGKRVDPSRVQMIAHKMDPSPHPSRLQAAIDQINRRAPQPVNAGGEGDAEKVAILITAIGEIAFNAGVYNGEVPLDGPQALMMLAHIGDELRLSPKADAEDGARLDWLEQMVQEAFVSSCFELDGGVHLTIERPSSPMEAHRNKNSLREAIDAARAQNAGGES